MKLIYTPTISTLYNCPSKYIKELVKILKHSYEKEYLMSYEKLNIKPFTINYMFRAEQAEEDTFNIQVYSGFIEEILKDIYKGKVDSIKDFSIESTCNKYMPSNYAISDILYKHQKSIVETVLNKKRGIVKSPTASGKSFAIAELVRITYQDNLKILITVPTIDLLHQLTKDILNYLSMNNIYNITIGKVGDGDYDIHNITIGIPQSLSNIEKTKDYLKTVQVLISDEVHTASNYTYASFLEYMDNTVIKVGLSATPGDNKFLEGFFGPRILSIEETDLINKQIIMEPYIDFYKAPKAFLPKGLIQYANQISTLPTAHRYKTYAQVYNHLIINNSKRNELICSIAIERIKAQVGPIIIIVNQIKDSNSHGQIIQSLLNSKGYNLPIISGYIGKKKRQEIITNLEHNLGTIAGPKVLTAGINIPSLSTIILCGAGKSDADFIQRVGRLLRKKEGKERPIVIDFIDTQYWFYNQSNTRINIAEQIYGKNNIRYK